MKEIRADAWQNKFCEREMAFCYCFQGPNTNVTLHLLSSGAEEQPHRTTTTIKVYDRAVYCLYLKCCYGCILYILSARPSSSLENIHIMFKACNHYRHRHNTKSTLSIPSSPIISGQHHCLNSYFLKCDAFYSCYHGHRRQGKLTEIALAHQAAADVKNSY